MNDIKDISDCTLLRVITDGSDTEWSFFALKIMITRLKLKLSFAHGDAAIQQQCCDEMRELLVKSKNIPNAIKDVKTIVERYGD